MTHIDHVAHKLQIQIYLKREIHGYIIYNIRPKNAWMSLIKEYFRLSKEAISKYGPKTILLMQVGAFYECYGEIPNNRVTIDEFCRTCELACANKAPGVIMAGFRDYSLEKYLNRLQEAGYTTVVHSQDAQNKEERALSGVYSPCLLYTSDAADE